MFKDSITTLLVVLYWLGLRISEIVGDVSRKYKVMWNYDLIGTLWSPDPNLKDEYGRIIKLPYPPQPEGFHKKYPDGFIYKWTKRKHGLRRRDVRMMSSYLRIDPDEEEIGKHGYRDEPIWMPLGEPGVSEFIAQWLSVTDLEG